MRGISPDRAFKTLVLCAFFSLIAFVYGANGPVTGCIEWGYDLPDSVYAVPAVGPSGAVYIPCENGNLYVVDPNGTLQGSFPSSGNVSLSAPAVSSDGMLYFGDANGFFQSIAQDGQINWSKTLDGAVTAAPTIADDMTVYVATLGGTLYAYSPDGTPLWEYSIPHPDQTIESIMASAAVGTDGTVYIAAMYSPKIYAIDPNSGTEHWVSDLTEFLDPDVSDAGRDHHGFVVTPAVDPNGTIYAIATYSKILFALNPVDGSVIWQAELNESEDTGLVAYWKLDCLEWVTQYGINDSQGNYDGTPYGISRLNITDGRIGNSFFFDGSGEYVQITGYKGITGGASRTCTAWIKAPNSSDEILSWGDLEYGGKWIIRINETGTLRAEVQGGYIYGSTVINDDAWHHIAVVLDSDGTPDISEVLLYVDGQLETPAAVSAHPIDTSATQDVSIGVHYSSLRYFRGLIDEVRIYDRALAPEEIKPLAMPEDYLVTRYGDAACWTSPVVGPDGTVYVSFDHPYLFAVNPNGSIKWCKRIGMTGGFTLAIDSENKIYAASEDGTLYVLDSDGDLLSRLNTADEPVNPVVLQDGHILLSGQNGKIWLLGAGSCLEQYDLTWSADLTNDGTVNLKDFVPVSQFWLQEDDFFILPENTFRLDRVDFAYLNSDIDRDFYVNLSDFMILCEQWLLNGGL